MSIKPITFSAPMVRALLAGTKTQTRRLVSKPEYYGCPTGDCPHSFQHECNAAMSALVDEIARYKVGDRLYVREHWSSHAAFDGLAPRDLKRGSLVYTRADGIWHNDGGEATGEPFGKHRQAMHMPRWASRLWLDVTEVCVQQLQDISEADCIAEGALLPWTGTAGSACDDTRTARGEFSTLWNSLHTEPGTRWENSPWVVAYSFAVHRGNVDEVGP